LRGGWRKEVRLKKGKNKHLYCSQIGARKRIVTTGPVGAPFDPEESSPATQVFSPGTISEKVP